MTSTAPSTRDPAPSPIPSGLTGQHLRACLRASARYLLRAQAASTDASGGDVTAAVIMIAVMSANVRDLDRDAPGRFGDYDDPPPDEIRRPVTALAVADRLGLPRETTRRRLDRLVRAGRCDRKPGGYFVPRHVIANQEHLASAQANLAAIARLRRDIDDGSDGIWPPMASWTPGRLSRPPLRLVNRRVAEFSLDVVAPLAKMTQGYDEAFVYLAAVEATGRHVAQDEPPTVSGYMLARSLGLPDESARRRLKKLVGLGMVQWRGDGYSAEPSEARTADVRHLAEVNFSALQRLFGALASDGVDLTARHA